MNFPFVWKMAISSANANFKVTQKWMKWALFICYLLGDLKNFFFLLSSVSLECIENFSWSGPCWLFLLPCREQNIWLSTTPPWFASFFSLTLNLFFYVNKKKKCGYFQLLKTLLFHFYHQPLNELRERQIFLKAYQTGWSGSLRLGIILVATRNTSWLGWRRTYV